MPEIRKNHLGSGDDNFGKIHNSEVSNLGLEFQVSSLGLGIFDEVSVAKLLMKSRSRSFLTRSQSRRLRSRLYHWPRAGWSKTASMKGHITVWGKFAGRKKRNSSAIRKQFCCSSRPNICCTRNAVLDSRVIFTLKFSVSLFGTQNTDFLLKKGTQHTNKITKQMIVSWFWLLSQGPH